MKNKGFTLIELLVAILIIGILAAIAVPQYQKAVEKSIISKMLVSIKVLHEAQQMYYLQTGNLSTKFQNLDINFPEGTLNSFTFDFGRGTQLAPSDKVIDMGDYELGIMHLGRISLACLKKGGCVGVVENEEDSCWPELYNKYICYQGYDGVKGYGSFWSSLDWCSKTFNMKSREHYFGACLSAPLIEIPSL